MKYALTCLFIFLCVWLTGCSTTQETLLPVDESTTMLSLWSQQTGDGHTTDGGVIASVHALSHRPLTAVDEKEQQSYTRTAENAIYTQFRRLPNPDMVMYVYPHLSGPSGVPVPGYSTVFPLYSGVKYALPGERTEAL